MFGNYWWGNQGHQGWWGPEWNAFQPLDQISHNLPVNRWTSSVEWDSQPGNYS